MRVAVTLIIVHYHFRPGGIRRVVELATPHLRRAMPRLDTVLLVSGEAQDVVWNRNFAKLIAPARLRFHTAAELGYFSELSASSRVIRRRIRQQLAQVFAGHTSDNCVVWAHNLGIGRNAILAEELARDCATRRLRLISHHHDWWFDNRWLRAPELRRSGYPNLAAIARTIFPSGAKIRHAAINQEDAKILSTSLKTSSAWLPNLAEPLPPPPAARVTEARRWLHRRLDHDGAPVWLLPCRLLRRKNVAEALLLTRWLRPEAWLVTTGDVSSADELPYFRKLSDAARRHHWRLRLGVLQGSEARKPTVPELLAASEAVLLTSIQEGFGLPYLEAAAAGRPLIARELPNIAPDLARFGFHFPQAYPEIQIPLELFDYRAERARQKKLFARWCRALPTAFRALAGTPALLQTTRADQTVPFSRLTLTAQLEVLTIPVARSWELGQKANPFLREWRERARRKRLQVTTWPAPADHWLSGRSYARRFIRLLKTPPPPGSRSHPTALQAAFVAKKLYAANLYPLLWTKEP
ncbi:MAG: glycosyltransferase [Verrucomicrobiae bacterium]|nr:glycosyltransferase [Verrucomicrobiae bacterium]